MTYYSNYYHGGYSYGGWSFKSAWASKFSYHYSYCKPKPKPEMKEYSFSAFSEDALGGNITCGGSFTMPGAATTNITVKDDDASLSGDCRDNATDRSGQEAMISTDGSEAGNGGQVYAEVYHKLCGSDGKTYYMVEVEQEGTNDDYFTFYGTVPPAGVTLSVVGTCNLRSVSYDKLGAGPMESANIDPTASDDAGTGRADECITVDVLANDDDQDNDTLVVSEVEGQAIVEGQTITLSSGTQVTLENGKLCFEGGATADALNVGQEQLETVSYTITDGNGGTASANVDITFCGVADTLEEFAASLPSGEVCYRIEDPYSFDGDRTESYTLTFEGTGDERLDGVEFEATYCVAAYAPLATGGDLGSAPLICGNLVLATANNADGILTTIGRNGETAAENLDLISWIMNQDFTSQDNGDGKGETYTDAELQGAIWSLTDNTTTAYGGGTWDNSLEIVNQAIAQGEGFEAGVGEIATFLVVPTAEEQADGNVQPMIIGMEFIDSIC